MLLFRQGEGGMGSGVCSNFSFMNFMYIYFKRETAVTPLRSAKTQVSLSHKKKKTLTSLIIHLIHFSLELIVMEMQRFTVLCDEITLDYQIADKDPRRCNNTHVNTWINSRVWHANHLTIRYVAKGYTEVNQH